MAMNTELMNKIRKDYENEPDKDQLHWESYVAGYMASLRRFAERRESRRETKSQLGYSRAGFWGRR